MSFLSFFCCPSILNLLKSIVDFQLSNELHFDFPQHYFQMEDGVVHVYANKDSNEKLFPVADATTFFTDLHQILKVIAAGNIRTLCHHRLVLLEQKFNLHLMLNADKEFLAQKSAPHRDFYNVRKVDTHVHHSACMNQKHLLRFIKSKLRKEPDEVVIFRDGTYLTLKEVFESLDLTGYDLNVDLLDVHADKSTFHRFDKFNLKYNPCGQSRLREIFLKQDNLIQGRFLGELTKQVFSDLEARFILVPFVGGLGNGDGDGRGVLFVLALSMYRMKADFSNGKCVENGHYFDFDASTGLMSDFIAYHRIGLDCTLMLDSIHRQKHSLIVDLRHKKATSSINQSTKPHHK
ncbi:unnamed protein product [Fraxinus pennsylvanica]|uniref:AMP deaminase n=1 Tax=Fraxinus pennsylvanica TaxID=56036 RepID=A0AAD2A7A8_9LAMI|nr:unnamed protein product [Fraxinus pennsylvanica]